MMLAPGHSKLARLFRLLKTILKATLFLATLAGKPATAPAQAQCDLKVVSAYTCDANGNAYKPRLGDTYYIRINWNVVGTPSSAYTVRFQMANQVWNWTGLPAQSGSYWGYAGWNLPLDGPIPYSITLDPDKVTGDTNYSNNTIKHSFTPIPPTAGIEYYNPATLQGAETFTINWNPGSGTVSNGFTLLGVPTTDSYQNVLSLTGPSGATQVNTDPENQPVWEQPWTNYTPISGDDTWTATQSFTVQVSAVQVNYLLLRKATWAQLAALPSSFQGWLESDALVQTSDPSIAAFVASVLPSNYTTTMTPYDAARKLFLAIVKRTTYVSPPGTDSSALSTLQSKKGDCLGFSTLHAACLRYIGIPARTLCGWWKGTNQWHCLMEFYLPNCGWAPADGSQDKVWWDPTGKYAYMFGYDPFLNQFCEVSRGTDHHTSDFSVTELQTGWFYYWGNATVASANDTCSLQ